MKALLFRDLKLAFGPGSGILVGILFFTIVITLTPFGIGSNPDILKKVGPGMLWIGALLATLLGLDRLFQIDREDGSLDLMIMNSAHHSLTLTVFIKCVAHWLGTVLPLVLISPVLGIMLNLDTPVIGITVLTLLIGTPAITLIGAVGAALAVSLPRGGILISVIVLPLVVPVIIFGVSATSAISEPGTSVLTPLLFLISLTLFFTVIGPFSAAATLKHLSE